MPASRSSPVIPIVPRRVHIAAVGFEVDRVAGPIIQMRADQAVLVANEERSDLAGSFRSQIVGLLRKAGIEPRVVRAPIFDLYSTTEGILGVIREHKKDRVFVNVSSGSKVQALSGYIASMLARAEGIEAEAYYAEPLNYAPMRDKPLSSGFKSAFYLPPLTLRIPTAIQQQAMRILGQGPLPKLSLSIQLAEAGFLDSSRLGRDGRPRDPASRVSLQSALDNIVIRPLRDWGFIATTRRGTRIIVSLTESGEQSLKLYRN